MGKEKCKNCIVGVFWGIMDGWGEPDFLYQKDFKKTLNEIEEDLNMKYNKNIEGNKIVKDQGEVIDRFNYCPICGLELRCWKNENI